MTVTVGIDPGQQGAIVELFGDGCLSRFWPMPIDTDTKDVNFKQLKSILSLFERVHVYLERAMPMAMGSKHAFNYGRGFAAIEIALYQSGLAYTLVEPRKWQKEIFQGIDQDLKPKAQALIAVKRLFPNEIDKIPVSPKAKKMHEGVVDALLIAEWGRRKVSS
jgi:hypothetical protein